VTAPAFTRALKKLKKAGAVRYERGATSTTDRKRPLSIACECYRVTKSEYDGLLNV